MKNINISFVSLGLSIFTLLGSGLMFYSIPSYIDERLISYDDSLEVKDQLDKKCRKLGNCRDYSFYELHFDYENELNTICELQKPRIFYHEGIKIVDYQNMLKLGVNTFQMNALLEECKE